MWKIFSKTDSIESRYVLGPQNTLFAGIFQPGKFKGWCSEGVNVHVRTTSLPDSRKQSVNVVAVARFYTVLFFALKQTHCAHVARDSDWVSVAFNPFPDPACKVSALKSAHTHARKPYIWWSYNKSTCSTVNFDRNSFTWSCERGKRP